MGRKINAKEEVTRKVMDYIELHQTGALSLDRIAKELNYSKYYMGRAFAQITGMTVHQYIKERRLAVAAEQLAKTNRPVIEIAFDAGYGSHQAFTQAFHGFYQCSPQDYRKKMGCRKNLVFQRKRVLQKHSVFQERVDSQKNLIFQEAEGLQRNLLSKEKRMSRINCIFPKDLSLHRNKIFIRCLAYDNQKGRLAA